jgi:hypothetical protein
VPPSPLDTIITTTKTAAANSAMMHVSDHTFLIKKQSDLRNDRGSEILKSPCAAFEFKKSRGDKN